MSTPFRYGVIKTLMSQVVSQLDAADYTQEAAAMASLTHIIACRIEPPDVATPWGAEYLLECIDHHRILANYLDQGAPDQ